MTPRPWRLRDYALNTAALLIAAAVLWGAFLVTR